jgi:protein TonB
LIHILLCLVLYGAFAPSSNLPLIETASFVDLVTLEEVSSTQDPLRYQASLAVKDSSAASLEQRAAAATQRSLPSKQRLVAEKDSSKQITASIKGVGFNAASKQGVLSASYLDGITSRLERYKRYPQRGLQRHLEAEVLLSLTINTDGEVANSAILSSSGFPFFDDEVLAMVKRAAPFSPPVQEGNASTITVIVPISFKLN